MTDTPRGVFRAFLNTDKNQGDDKPTFQGNLTLPNAEDQERAFALWGRATKNGGIMLTGRTTPVQGKAIAQIANLITPVAETAPALTVPDRNVTLKPGEIVLFQSKSDDGGKRPAFYGWHHSGIAGQGLLDVAVWAKTDTKGRAILTGNLQDMAAVPAQRQDSEPEQV
jgi:hypothetical protein